jgi:hypothetical protein
MGGRDDWKEGPWYVSSREGWGNPDYCAVLCKATDKNGDEVTVLIAENQTRETAERVVRAVNNSAAALESDVIAVVREALRSIVGWRELRSGMEFPVERIEEIASAALALLATDKEE